MRIIAFLSLLLLVCNISQAQQPQVKPTVPLRPVHTFSIVARDPTTGELGVAVQSHWFSVGTTVVWAEAGVGAVATQSFVDPSYGRNGLDLMRAGKSGPDSLKELLAKDEAREVRQVAMIDKQGRVDAWTGKNDIQAAGHIVGTDFSVQANLMLNDKVFDLRTMYSGIAFNLFKVIINLVRNYGRKVVDIWIPITIKGGREKEPGIVIEDHKSHIVKSAYAISV